MLTRYRARVHTYEKVYSVEIYIRFSFTFYGLMHVLHVYARRAQSYGKYYLKSIRFTRKIDVRALLTAQRSDSREYALTK